MDMPIAILKYLKYDLGILMFCVGSKDSRTNTIFRTLNIYCYTRTQWVKKMQ